MIHLHTASSMRAALNSKYCMRAQIKARNLVDEQDGYQTVTRQANEQGSEEHFSYQEGQHRVVSNGKLHLPEEVKVIKTKNGKRWSTSSMKVELAKDILEVRDGLGKVVDARVFKQKI